MRSIRFPPELVDRVIDYLHDHPHTLKSISLVCRAWSAASQLHLFHTVNLSSETRSGSFLKVLQSAPKLAGHVRELRVEQFRRRAGRWIADSTTILELIPKLHGVKSLSIVTKAYAEDRRFGWPIFARLGSVERLAISEFETPARAHREKDGLALFLNRFPRLRFLALSVSPDYALEPPHDISKPLRPCFHLSTLELGECCDLWTLDWLLKTPPVLECLDLSCNSAANVAHAERILAATGMSLKSLKLRALPQFDGPGMYTWLQTRVAADPLRSEILRLLERAEVNTSPLSLRLENFPLVTGVLPQLPLYPDTLLLKALQTMPAGSLDTLIVGLDASGDAPSRRVSKAVAWENVDDVLARRVPELKRLDIVIRFFQGDSSELERQIKAALPRISAIAYLFFSHRQDVF